METIKNPPDARCAICGTAFSCGMQAGQEPCWCASLPALKPVPGRECLCARCLGGEIAKGKDQQAYRRDGANDYRPRRQVEFKRREQAERVTERADRISL